MGDPVGQETQHTLSNRLQMRTKNCCAFSANQQVKHVLVRICNLFDSVQHPYNFLNFDFKLKLT